MAAIERTRPCGMEWSSSVECRMEAPARIASAHHPPFYSISFRYTPIDHHFLTTNLCPSSFLASHSLLHSVHSSFPTPCPSPRLSKPGSRSSAACRPRASPSTWTLQSPPQRPTTSSSRSATSPSTLSGKSISLDRSLAALQEHPFGIAKLPGLLLFRRWPC